MEQARGAHAEQAGLGPQAQGQFGGQDPAGFLDGVAITLHIQQAERQGRFIDIAQLLAEERFVLLLADTQAGLGHVVAIRHGLAQRCVQPEQAGLQLLAQHLQSGMVQHQVMEQQHRHRALSQRVVGMHQTDQRRPGQVQAIVTGVETRLQLRQDLTVRRIERDGLDRQLRAAPDHLHRLVQAFPENTGTQDIVTVDHLLQNAGEVLQALRVIKGHLRLQQVRIALPGTQVVVENTFLQRRQRVDILHVGRAARHAGDDPVDTGLVQLDEWQQLRGDLLAVGWNAVVRHPYRPPTAHCGSQRRQAWLVEQHADIGTQADLTHPLDQADGQ